MQPHWPCPAQPQEYLLQRLQYKGTTILSKAICPLPTQIHIISQALFSAQQPRLTPRQIETIRLLEVSKQTSCIFRCLAHRRHLGTMWHNRKGKGKYCLFLIFYIRKWVWRVIGNVYSLCFLPSSKINYVLIKNTGSQINFYWGRTYLNIILGTSTSESFKWGWQLHNLQRSAVICQHHCSRETKEK